MRFHRLFAVLSIAVLIVGGVRAQPSPSTDTSAVAFEVNLPDSVVVTATRVAAEAQTTGRQVSIYTQRDIQNLSVNSVDQLLDVVGGVDVQSRGGFGVQSDLKMRGSTFNGVLLLLDGARINDPYTGHFLMDLPVPLSEIARVEVLHGPATALYGPDALGGVVHLITKTALRSGRMPDTGLAARVDGRYGKNNFYDVSGAARDVGANTTVSAAASVQGSDGQTVSAAESDGLSSTVQTDFHRRAATAAVSRNVGDATFYARAGVDDREFGAYHFYTDFASDRAREATSTFWLQSRLASAHDAETPWQVQIAGKQHRDRYTYNPAVGPNRHISRMLNVQGQASRTWGTVHVTGGASGGVRGVDSNRDGVHRDASVGTFVSLRWQATSRLTVNQSTRLDYDPVYGVEPTPQLYVAYDLGAATLRAGGGRVVRAPNYLERFIDSPTNQGNENLDAETAWSGEVGADVQMPANLSLSVTGFHRSTENAIDYLRREAVFVARNLDRTTTTGLETEMTFDRQMGPAGVRLSAAYTFLDATLDAQRPTTAYKYGLNSARHHVQGSAAMTVGAVTVSLQGTWRDRLTDIGLATDRYGVVHSRLAYQTRLGGARTTLSAEVRNAFDRQYSEIFDAPMPNRTLLVGASVQL
ncbi:TonB-dependent receptor [Salinibacter sp. 10B]|uniref:TonB-dependent receptor plug domain-containing protein n=1 Tax=Salinibacter sp. 10B TaxID=1923971 RepID=UPI000CF42F8E|nr:TonB-dependent receptor plug domain-containing protein [Salinibacter sp. 10B]PQJ34917.1 TonB-dependent receptor [Salinibacter sp. 10B]